MNRSPLAAPAASLHAPILPRGFVFHAVSPIDVPKTHSTNLTTSTMDIGVVMDPPVDLWDGNEFLPEIVCSCFPMFST